ncbi:SdiA-regulated domain-containing protein [Pseudothauera rhizosphaerae]|uniref:DNA-binding protein n=1 Tax=Pseudothauera rhizosphaerae TaxID=2565932 RepID=A0A4V6RX63_9RHOO|nr:SdiA-regulated domain-containing protein [Pseudothauera rhizosphaerae]THF63323.1 DNA-binding protein [Pseudothauera rhizosphaerae]
MADRRGWRRWLPAALVLAAALGVLEWRFQPLNLTRHWLQMKAGESRWAAAGIWLPAYSVTIDARVIEGIDGNASGLTFDPVRGSLYTVTNKPPAVFEVSREGKPLRLLPLRGITDPEGIAHVRGDLFVIADERSQQLVLVRIGADATAVDASDAPRLGLAIDLDGNRGFEGVSWDSVRGRLLVVKEKSPLRIYEINGLPEALSGGRLDLQISEWKEPGSSGLFMHDLSSLTLHEPTGHMLLLSDESRLVVEYDAAGTLVSLMPLWPGWHGLAHGIAQAEGVALDDEGALYLLSEPNLFYRFERTTPAAWQPQRAAAGR